MGILKECNFYQYTNKRSYRVGLDKTAAHMNGLSDLASLNYNDQQRKSFIRRVWHSWLLRKLAAMQWLHLAGALPIGQWRSKAARRSTCGLCSSSDIETVEHTLYKCNRVSPILSLMFALRRNYGLADIYNTWPNIRFGLPTRHNNTNIEEASAWDSVDKVLVNDNTP